MKQYKNPTVIEEFRKRFPRVSEMFTAPAKGELTDIEQFLDEQLTKKEEEVIERIKEQMVEGIPTHFNTDMATGYVNFYERLINKLYENNTKISMNEERGESRNHYVEALLKANKDMKLELAFLKANRIAWFLLGVFAGVIISSVIIK